MMRFRDPRNLKGLAGLFLAAAVALAMGGIAPAAENPAPDAGEKIRVACLGDSITEGSGYADALQNLLGNRFVVRNFGLGGTTMLSKGDKPYVKAGKYQAAKDFQPHAAILMFGTNDTKPQNYAHIAEFAADCRRLIEELQALPTHPKVFLCKPVPVYGKGNYGIDEGRLREGVLPAIEQVAKEKGLPMIDMYAALSGKPELFKDNIHPTGGQAFMARAALAVIRREMPRAPVTDNLVANPGIESGLEPWSSRGGQVAVVSELVKSGSKALKITGRTAGWHGPGQDVLAAVAKKGRGTYNVRASVRLADGAKPGNAKVILMTTDDSGVHYLGTRDRTLAPGEWVDFDDDVYVSWTGTLKGAFLYIEAPGAADADFVVDDFGLSSPQR